MKITLITATYNSEKTIRDTIESVLSQNYPDIEYIIIDGASKDNTIKIANEYKDKIAKILSEPDKGIYDAMNKGIKYATGDIVGILNSDDFYASKDVITNIVNIFKTKKVDSVFADLVFIDPDKSNKIVRYYNSSNFSPDKFAYGIMPAHPTFFVKKIIYDQFGTFKTDYKIASDFELLTRLLAKQKITYNYHPQTIIKMRTGGLSTKNLKSNLIINQEIVRACNENGISTNLLKVYSKYFFKIFQLIQRPKH